MILVNIEDIAKRLDGFFNHFSFHLQSAFAVLFVVATVFCSFHAFDQDISLQLSWNLFYLPLAVFLCLLPVLVLGLWAFRINTFASNKSLVFHVAFLVLTAGVCFKAVSWDYGTRDGRPCHGEIQNVKLVGMENNDVVVKLDLTGICENFQGAIRFAVPESLARKWDRGMKVKFEQAKTRTGIQYFQHLRLTELLNNE